MSVYDLIAAGHRGQCFALLGRRFMISEPQAALAVRHLLPAVFPAFEAWVSAPGGLAAFLDAMNRGGYEQALSTQSVLTNPFERNRGAQLLEQFRSAREIDGASMAVAVDASGLSYRVLLHLLPFVVLLMMAGLRLASQTPLREILNRRTGARLKPGAYPFAELADLVAWEAKGQRPGDLVSMLDRMFRQRVRSEANQSGPIAASVA